MPTPPTVTVRIYAAVAGGRHREIAAVTGTSAEEIIAAFYRLFGTAPEHQHVQFLPQQQGRIHGQSMEDTDQQLAGLLADLPEDLLAYRQEQQPHDQ